MASTTSADPTAAPTQLLDHPWEQADPARHRLPRQTRGGSPLLGVTATMAATFGAAGLTAAAAGPAAAAEPAVSAPDGAQGAADPGLALAARIQQQADTRTAAEETARLAAAQEAEARRAAAAVQAPVAAPAARPRTDAPSAPFAAPLSGFSLGAVYGPGGSHWAALHTGLDFEAPAGTPVTAVGDGTVTSAGWAGSYGYRVVQTLPDGTEIWYCHLARLGATSGHAPTGTVLGAVGATGSVTSPRLHLEIRPGGGAPTDPQPWLQARGIRV
ncbi:M23 family metallopeptidase [Kitasatospora sp. NPDC059571]|uniref:M23 family metallopeptidase n=1 Tax=Kitasatospora sp. NPDC059571 TaxID=3346871 RepID=UPI0036A5FFAD